LAGDQKRHIVVEVVSKSSGLKEMAGQLGVLNRQVLGISKSFSSMRSLFSGVAGASIFGFGIREIVEISDSMQLLSSRINVLSGGAEQGGKVFKELQSVARNTGASIEGVAQVYARLAASTKELNISQTSLLKLTEFLQNTYRLSGATTEEAVNSTIQLSQAFSLGVLRGQDFKSVVSQNVVLADLLTKGLGKTRGQLQKMAEEGRLTNSVVLPALAKGMEQVRNDADKLGLTIGQSVTIAFDRFKIVVKELNENLGISNKVAAGIDLVSKSLLAFALTAVPAAISGLISLGKALTAVALSNPWTAFFAALGFGIGLIVQNFDLIVEKAFYMNRYVGIAFQEMAISILDGWQKVREFFGKDRSLGLDKEIARFSEKKKLLQDEIRTRIEAEEKASRLAEEKRRREEAETASELSRIKQVEELETIRARVIRELNESYDRGRISVSKYYSTLRDLDAKIAKSKFLTGKTDLEQYLSEQTKNRTTEITSAFNKGTISIQEFNAAIEENKVAELNADLEKGKISLIEYDSQLVKISEKFLPGSALRVGAQDYLNSIGTLSKQIAGLVTGTFSKLEDALVEFTKNGKFSFRDFAQAVLDDLNRIIIRSLIIRPLAEGILTSIPSAAASASAGRGPGTYSQFAMGGVFDSPTPFTYGRGKLGVLGEAGPEAILPLRKSPDGSLGVSAASSPVYVNITNQTGGEVTQTESTGPNGEKILDILISNKVKEGIASGQFDRTFQSAYGLKRRGN
jgi:lambda family phage tail tape measure protein